MKENMLEVGDELYRYIGFGNAQRRIEGKVDKVTKTLAFIGTLKLRRELRMGFTNVPGASGYSCATYRLVTEKERNEIAEEQKRRALMKPLINIIDNGRGSISYLTNEQLERINEILASKNAL